MIADMQLFVDYGDSTRVRFHQMLDETVDVFVLSVFLDGKEKDEGKKRCGQDTDEGEVMTMHPIVSVLFQFVDSIRNQIILQDVFCGTVAE